MSTKKEKCCEKCLSTNGWMKGECFNGNCTCHQSESIEWEKFAEKVSENFDSIYRKFPANEAAVIIRNRIKNSFPSLISQAITTAVEAREREISEAVDIVGIDCGCVLGKCKMCASIDFIKSEILSFITTAVAKRELDNVLSLLKH